MEATQQPGQGRALTRAEYARRILIAEKLVKLGCKWPILHELLQLRVADAQRLVIEVSLDRRLLSRLEKGMYWFRAPATYNLRMTHATFLYHLYSAYDSAYPALLQAEKLLWVYSRYLNLVAVPVIDNINRAHYLLDSLRRGKGFEVRLCAECGASFVAVGSVKTRQCTACERNQYISCGSCGALIDRPYAPGSNGSRKLRCNACAQEARREKRRLRARRRYVY